MVAIICGFERDGRLVSECVEVRGQGLFGCLFGQFLFSIFGFDFDLVGMFCVHLNCNSKNIIEIIITIIQQPFNLLLIKYLHSF